MAAKPKDGRKEVFTVLAEVRVVDGKKKIAMKSPDHYEQSVQQLPVGRKIAVTVEEYAPTRSKEQLSYHFVLLGYIATHTGYSVEECHDTVMRAKFGTKKVVIGNLTQEVRRSISGVAKMPKYDAVELIDFDLNLCKELGINVPTRQELGYLPS